MEKIALVALSMSCILSLLVVLQFLLMAEQKKRITKLEDETAEVLSTVIKESDANLDRILDLRSTMTELQDEMEKTRSSCKEMAELAPIVKKLDTSMNGFLETFMRSVASKAK